MRRIVLIALALAATVGGRETVARPGGRPHVVFVLADDLGPGDLGFEGGELARTPNLDRMAREGVRLGSYYAPAPICSPSRCGLITGAFPARWRITSYLQTKAGNRACGQADFLDPAAPSLPRTLKEAGYATAHFGKWHLGGGRDVVDAPKFAAYGYDEHAGTYESPEPDPKITATDWIWSEKDEVKRWERTGYFVDRTLDFLARHKDEKPCFVNVWLDDVHTPWVPDEAAGKGASTARNLKRVTEEMDRQIGRLREGLRELGIEERTLLIFTSDNGPLPVLKGRRSGGLRGAKLSLYEGGTRLPFVAVWPGTIEGGQYDEKSVVGGVDVFPSICRIAGEEAPGGLDGEDRSGVMLGKESGEREQALFWEYGRGGDAFAYPGPRNGGRADDRSPTLAVRDGRWKLLVNGDGTGAELYDIETDPAEARDRAADEKDVAERLTRKVLEWKGTLP
jgi:arylsulfatase A-like enzyme